MLSRTHAVCEALEGAELCEPVEDPLPALSLENYKKIYISLGKEPLRNPADLVGSDGILPFMFLKKGLFS